MKKSVKIKYMKSHEMSCVCDNIENKHSLYRGEDCLKKFFSSLRKHATNVINFEKEKMLPLTKKSYNYTKI